MAGSLQMNFYTPLGYFNSTVHINMTSMGPQGYVRLMQRNGRMRRARAELHLNMPNRCRVDPENYYRTAHSHVWRGVVMVCHLQLLGSDRGMGRPAVANFVCTGFFFFPLQPNLSPRPVVSLKKKKKDCSGTLTFRKHG